MRREPVVYLREEGGTSFMKPLPWLGVKDLVSLLGLERVVINYSGKGEPCEEVLMYFSSLFWSNDVTCPSEPILLWK